MRLYHCNNYKYLRFLVLSLVTFSLIGCIGKPATKSSLTISIGVDKKIIPVRVETGSTVQEALNAAQIVFGGMDRVDPPLNFILSENTQVDVVRVSEEFYVKNESIPYEHQELQNEGLPAGDRRISQPGVNGMKESTYHRVYEDGVEVSNSIVKTIILKNAVPEIVMVGGRGSYESIKIPGKITYISAGNAWKIEGSTSNRELIISSGDLDGRIFSLSKNGKYLLFSRDSDQENSINSLWVAMLESEPVRLINLDVKNIVHFADFNPDSSLIAYSTVEWRETAPGWQANNDLYTVNFNQSGEIGKPVVLMDSNSGGIYGWWGTEFSWSPDGKSLLYSRPDGVGLFDIEQKTMTLLLNVKPYQATGDWAWVPPASWSPDGKFIYIIDHQSTNDEGSDENQIFDLITFPLMKNTPVRLQEDVGMFSYPVPSPILQKPSFINSMSAGNLVQEAFSIAFLQAIFPDQSDVAGYRLDIIDRDGSNMKSLYPEEGGSGLEPQRVVWSPEPMNTAGGYTIAFLYNGNIWLEVPDTGVSQQITGDGLTSHLDWR